MSDIIFAPSEVVWQLLIDLGLATEASEWPAFIGFSPETPDQAIILYDTAGVMDGRLMSTGERIEHPGIQIRVRGPEYETTFRKVRDIANKLALVNRTSVALEGGQPYTVHNISQPGAILPVGLLKEGERENHNFTLNVITTIEKG